MKLRRLSTVTVERPRCPECGGVRLRKYRTLADQGDGSAPARLPLINSRQGPSLKRCEVGAGGRRKLAPSTSKHDISLLICCLARCDHRLRAIGQVHEAEDESQQWPDLHTAIRDARRAYDTDGTIVDWGSLEPPAGDVRQPE